MPVVRLSWLAPARQFVCDAVPTDAWHVLGGGYGGFCFVERVNRKNIVSYEKDNT